MRLGAARRACPCRHGKTAPIPPRCSACTTRRRCCRTMIVPCCCHLSAVPAASDGAGLDEPASRSRHCHARMTESANTHAFSHVLCPEQAPAGDLSQGCSTSLLRRHTPDIVRRCYHDCSMWRSPGASPCPPMDVRRSNVQLIRTCTMLPVDRSFH
jgi:hypothetical protein